MRTVSPHMFNNTSCTISYIVPKFFKSDFPSTLMSHSCLRKETCQDYNWCSSQEKKIDSWHLCIYMHKYWIGKTKESRRLKEKYEEHNPRRWVCVKVDKSVCWFEGKKGESEKVRLSELKQAIWLGESLNACECDWKLWTDKKKRCFEFQAALMESSAGIQMIIWRKIVSEREKKCHAQVWLDPNCCFSRHTCGYTVCVP